MKLLFDALVKFIFGLVLVGVLLFLPAGTLAYGGAWLFLALLFVPMCIMGIVLFIKAPELLRKRLNNKEKEKEAKEHRLQQALLKIKKKFELEKETVEE